MIELESREPELEVGARVRLADKDSAEDGYGEVLNDNDFAIGDTGVIIELLDKKIAAEVYIRVEMDNGGEADFMPDEVEVIE